jgi:hypothetical protein
MSIRSGNSCKNCEQHNEGFCMVHKTTVGPAYTCDSFEMRAELKDDPNCITCVRYEKPDCANPQKAAPAMLCNHWARRATA